MIQLSIIIPVYNVEAWLERCLHSLQNQDLPKDQYEIIVINDGSPDNSRAVVTRLQTEYSNIILIDQLNEGVSAARNVGIAKALGKYILPVDPDDYVKPNVLKKIVSKAIDLNLEVVYLNYDFEDINGKVVWQTDYAIKSTCIFSGPDAYFEARNTHVRDPDRSVAILFDRELLYKFNIQYPRKVPYLEDGLFLGKVFMVASRCGFMQDPFYVRTTRTGSATNSDLFYSSRALDGFLLAAMDLRSFANSYKPSKDSIQLCNHVLAKFVLTPMLALSGKFKWRKYNEFVKRVKKCELYPLNITGCRVGYLEYARIFNFSTTLFYYYNWGLITTYYRLKYLFVSFGKIAIKFQRKRTRQA